MASCIMEVATYLFPDVYREHTVTESPATHEDIPLADSKNGMKLRKNVKLESDSIGIFQEAESSYDDTPMISFSHDFRQGPGYSNAHEKDDDGDVHDLMEICSSVHITSHEIEKENIKQTQNDVSAKDGIAPSMKSNSIVMFEASYDDTPMISLSRDFRQVPGYSNAHEKDDDGVVYDLMEKYSRMHITSHELQREKENIKQTQKDVSATDGIAPSMKSNSIDMFEDDDAQMEKAKETEDEMKP